MSAGTLDDRLAEQQKTIRLLERELAETNSEVVLLNLELDKRVETRTQELRLAQEELKRKNSELETFAYSVSHDLRAPLRRILGFIRLIQLDHTANLGSEAPQLLDKVAGAATEMTKLIDDLLAFSRTGTVEMHKVPVDFGKQVASILEEMSPELHGRNVEWDIQPLPVTQVDGALLKQVWINLLSNAIKYTRPRDPAKIRVGFSDNGNEREFFVQDNGVGFDMKYAEKLFGVFQRMHGPAEFEGTGVGLASVQQIIRRHGGRVWAKAEVGQGASFHFTLPAS